MSITVDLPADLESELADEAARAGVPLPEYVRQLLARCIHLDPAPRDGAELVAYWQREGLIGCRPDGADGPTHARALREQAQRRSVP